MVVAQDHRARFARAPRAGVVGLRRRIIDRACDRRRVAARGDVLLDRKRYAVRQAERSPARCRASAARACASAASRYATWR
jgi:hypothetical protein